MVIMSVMKKLIVTIIVVVMTFFVASSISDSLLNKAAGKPFSDQETHKTFVVKQGENVKQVGLDLQKEGLISSSSVFIRYAKKAKRDKQIRAGTYDLNTKMSTRDVLAVLVSGERKEAWITIPEGWKIDQIVSYLNKEKLPAVGEFKDRAKVKNFSSYPFLSGLSGNTSLEGYLFPDTYLVYADSTADEIIEKMLDNFGDKFTKNMMDKANKKGFSMHEFLTLVSIVEKESAHSEDIRKIASVYYNRLREGMNLQSDATITYITGRADARPTVEETRIKSPYNTYLNPGLPPGPVGNPGLLAIEATLNPESTNYYFFVSRDGRAYFAATYEEHVQNINKYLGG